jgi:hypothetical protein
MRRQKHIHIDVFPGPIHGRSQEERQRGHVSSEFFPDDSVIRFSLILGQVGVIAQFSGLESRPNRLVAEKIHFVIRLNLGSQQPTPIDEDRQALELRIMPGKKIACCDLGYLEKVKINIIGVWRKEKKEGSWLAFATTPRGTD